MTNLKLIGLFLTFNIYATSIFATTSSGGGPVLMSQVVHHEPLPDFNGDRLFNEELISNAALYLTQNDSLKAQAVINAYDFRTAHKIQNYYGDQISSAAYAQVASKTLTASILNNFGGYSEDEAVEAVIFEPEFSAAEMQNIIDLSL